MMVLFKAEVYTHIKKASIKSTIDRYLVVSPVLERCVVDDEVVKNAPFLFRSSEPCLLIMRASMMLLEPILTFRSTITVVPLSKHLLRCQLFYSTSEIYVGALLYTIVILVNLDLNLAAEIFPVSP